MTLVMAHRGASRLERENTIAAFRRAAEVRADGVELDARLTADGELVVHHDPLLADGRAIIEVSFADLPSHVPTLSDALDACVGLFVNIEIKNDPSEPDFDPDEAVLQGVVKLLKARGASKRWLISSFRTETVIACRDLLPQVRTAWLVEQCSISEIEAASTAGLDAIHPWVSTLTADLVHASHARGLAVNTWTCNEPDRIAELMAWGVDGICTDVPDIAVAVRAKIASALD